jgi:CRISPR-associated protein Csm4
MKYTLYKLSFSAPVHFGSGRLGKTMYTVYADTLFSAMCTEMQKVQSDGAKLLYEAAVSGRLSLSDAMPYSGRTLFVPKPMTAIESKTEGDSGLKKEFKRLVYIPVDDLDDYLSGNYDPAPANKLLRELGSAAEQVRVSEGRGDDSLPYSVGTYRFSENCGLYFICGADEEIQPHVDDLMDSLSYTGIGGKLSSGLGRFDYTYKDVPDSFLSRFQGGYSRYMTLSVCMAKECELESVLDGAGYELIKRSGFVASPDYAVMPVKKRDFYAFKAGACFAKPFEGDVFDVGGSGAHPVYRYAKPMLIGIEVRK